MNLLKKSGMLFVLGASSALLHAGCAMNVDELEAPVEDSAAFTECEPLPVAAAAASDGETPEKATCRHDQGEAPHELGGTRGCLLQCSMRYAYCLDRSETGTGYRHSRAGDGGCYEHYWRCTRACYSGRLLILAEQAGAD